VKENEQLWVVGQIYVNHPSVWGWGVVGIFDDEALAVQACKDHAYFVAPAKLNERFSDKAVEWPGAYYPIDVPVEWKS
jgi:hypothetical protein